MKLKNTGRRNDLIFTATGIEIFEKALLMLIGMQVTFMDKLAKRSQMRHSIWSFEVEYCDLSEISV